VIDAISGNASGLSNPATVTIVSIASDYNGDSYSDAALYGPSTTMRDSGSFKRRRRSRQLQLLPRSGSPAA